jgi:hypothetical protein
MNVFVTAIIVVVFAVLGFLLGCLACITKINQLEYEKKTLTEWLETSRKTNESLVKECNGLLADLESVVNGNGIIHDEEIETETD